MAETAVVEITLAECLSCESITINPTSDECACGREFYPVSRSVPSHTRIAGVTLGAVRVSPAAETAKR